MKPRKGQFRFSAPPKITHEEQPAETHYSWATPSKGGKVTVKATHLGKPAGELRLGQLDEVNVWNDPKKGSRSGIAGTKPAREVSSIEVPKAKRRKGIATAMWKYAKDNNLHPEHSPLQTSMGEAWSKKVGD